MVCSSIRNSEANKAYFRRILVSEIRPNPWNPNRIPPDKYRKLKEAVAEKGLLCPIIVRPTPGRVEGDESFEIIDGEHRFQIARSLNIQEIPCVVVELTDKEAKIKTLQFNGLRGENEPERLARLVSDLNFDYDLDQLERMLPLDKFDLQASIDLLAVMDRKEPDYNFEEEMRKLLETEVFSVVVTMGQKSVIEHALVRHGSLNGHKGASDEAGPDINERSEGQMLAEICEIYLSNKR